MGIFPCASLKCQKVNLVATEELIKRKKVVKFKPKS